MLNSISENMTQGRCTIASFIDLSKAFDCLQYDKLFTKMRYIGFTDNTVLWFQDYLSNRQQVVDVDSTVSDQQPMQLGVPQGSILGPILFLIYVNDINNCDKTAEFVKFADDTTIITTGASIEEAAHKMNASLTKVAKWFLCNKLNLNPSKTRYMIFNSNTNRTDLIQIGNQTLERVWDNGQEKSFKLVGIHIDENLKWQHHIKKLLYSGLIHSHLVYDLPIWGAATKGRLDTLLTKQKKAIRKIYNLRYRDHTKPYFVRGRILQLPELIEHTTLCYIQSGIHSTSPSNVQKLWRQKLDTRELRDKGIKLDFKVSNRDYINNLPPIRHAKIWNNHSNSTEFQADKPTLYKAKLKDRYRCDYVSSYTEEELQIHSKIIQRQEENSCLLYTSPSPRDRQKSRMPSSA